MKINKLIKQNNNKYKIIIDDNSIITYEDVILENGLLYKKEINQFLYEKIIEDTNFYDTYNDVLKFALKKIRSEKEIIEYMEKYDLLYENKTKIIDKLKDLNLINDEKYARAYINDKLNLSKSGINKIKKELITNNISNDIIENELNNIDLDIEKEKLEKMIIKKLNSNHKYSNNYMKQKILNEMINLGYLKDDILEILNNNIMDDENIIIKEYDKIYDKLKSKYSGAVLKQKIQQKLLYKGFSIEQINELITKKTED